MGRSRGRLAVGSRYSQASRILPQPSAKTGLRSRTRCPSQGSCLMATPAIDSEVRLRRGDSGDLDDVMEVMDAAFGSRFGEAWTRSQCAGILPMTGVCLVV